MTGAVSAYPNYKDSNAPWLGQVPAHWDVVPNRAIFREINERGHSEEEMLSVTINRGVLRQAELLANSSKKDSSNQDKSNYKLVCPGDLTYNKMRAWQGAAGVSQYRGIVSPAYIVVRPHEEQVMRYFHYLFRTPAFAKEAERWSYGISSDQWSLRIDEFKRIYASVPPRDEQAAIVRFLDDADRRIRRFILAKRKLISLLNEQKQVIIHRAVTRGLDPDVRLKPSRLEWVDEIPESWSVTAVKRLLSRMDYGTSDSLAGTGSIKVLTMGHVRDGGIVLPDEGSINDVPHDLFLKHEDLLFNRTNSPELVGKVGIFRGQHTDRVSFASYLVRLRAAPPNDAGWLNYLLNSTRFWAFARSQALVSLHQANLNSTRYGQLLIPVPPDREQREIAEYLTSRMQSFSSASQRLESEISLAQEYRGRLIADVVTGNLDVREAATQLPDDVDESDTTVDGEGDEGVDFEPEEVEA